MRCVVALVAVLLAGPAAADRMPYGKTVELEVSNEQLIVHHHHDWSRIGLGENDAVSYSVAEPFGVGNDYSSLSARSASSGSPLWQVPSPPLTWLGISRDGRHIIGLSNIMRANITQLVVFAGDGRLLARRWVTSTSCVPRKTREAEIARHPANQQRAYAEFTAPECLPPGHLVRESVTNFVRWYSENDPAPRVIEDAGQVVAVELNGLQGKRMRVTFDPRTVRSQQPVDGQHR
jgi:hypothetical protein